MKRCQYCNQEYEDNQSPFCTLACSIEFGFEQGNWDHLKILPYN